MSIRLRLILISSLLVFGLQSEKSTAQVGLPYETYLPLILQQTPCLTYTATMWLEAPEQVRSGQEFTSTVFLRNDGCSFFGMPMYGIHAEPGVTNPPPYLDSGSIGPSEIGWHTFTLTVTLTNTSTITIYGGSFFEVFYPPPPGPFSWGNAGAPPITVTLEDEQP